MDTNSKFIVCNVNDWHEFMKLTAIFNTQAWLFRGQADSSWKLQTTHERFINNRKSKFEFRMNNSDPIMRSLDEIVDKDIISPNEQILKNAENYAIEKFKKHVYQYIKFGNNTDLLAAMQHYGAPTRLLDVTSSIFVALYFAFEKNSCNTKSVWAFRKEQLLHGQGELDTVKKAKEQYKKTLETDPQYAPDTYENGIMWFLENEYQQEKECIELVEEILNSSHKEAKGIVPVVPGYYNRRIAAQSGSFLFSTTLLDSFESNLKHTLNFNAEEFDNPSQYAIKDYFDGKFDFQSANLIKFNFNPVNCFSAENIFHNANISAKKLFPDLTGIAKSIRYKNET